MIVYHEIYRTTETSDSEDTVEGFKMSTGKWIVLAVGLVLLMGIFYLAPTEDEQQQLDKSLQAQDALANELPLFRNPVKRRQNLRTGQIVRMGPNTQFDNNGLPVFGTVIATGRV
jgi:hypothetical protein